MSFLAGPSPSACLAFFAPLFAADIASPLLVGVLVSRARAAHPRGRSTLRCEADGGDRISRPAHRSISQVLMDAPHGHDVLALGLACLTSPASRRSTPPAPAGTRERDGAPAPRRHPRARRSARPATAAPQTYSFGSTAVPFSWTSKCRWHPVDAPVVPDAATMSPRCTVWPTLTLNDDRWWYEVVMTFPSSTPWLMISLFPARPF